MKNVFFLYNSPKQTGTGGLRDGWRNAMRQVGLHAKLAFSLYVCLFLETEKGPLFAEVLFSLVTRSGFEPETPSLKVKCSTY